MTKKTQSIKKTKMKTKMKTRMKTKMKTRRKPRRRTFKTMRETKRSRRVCRLRRNTRRRTSSAGGILWKGKGGNFTQAEYAVINKNCRDLDHCLALNQHIDIIKDMFDGFDLKYSKIEQNISNVYREKAKETDKIGTLGKLKPQSFKNMGRQHRYKSRTKESTLYHIADKNKTYYQYRERDDYTVKLVFKRQFKDIKDKPTYQCNAILKSSSILGKYSMFYEAFVGVFINKKSQQYPCFIQTYGCYLHNDNSLKQLNKLIIRDTNTDFSTLYNERIQIVNHFNTNGLNATKTTSMNMNYNDFLDSTKIKTSCEKHRFFAVLRQFVIGDSLMAELNDYFNLDLMHNENKLAEDRNKDPRYTGITTNKQDLFNQMFTDRNYYEWNLMRQGLESTYTPSSDIEIMVNVRSNQDWAENKITDTQYIHFNLMNYFYQIYCPLASMNTKERFIHYDLSLTNVWIYKPNGYITMNYHYSNPDGTERETVSFNTLGIAKIINYSCCYFDDTLNGGSSTDAFLQKTDAVPNCSDEVYENALKQYHVASNSNKDDLFIVKYIAKAILGDKKIGVNKRTYENQTDQHITTVQQMHQALKNYIQSNPDFIRINAELTKDIKYIEIKKMNKDKDTIQYIEIITNTKDIPQTKDIMQANNIKYIKIMNEIDTKYIQIKSKGFMGESGKYYDRQIFYIEINDIKPYLKEKPDPVTGINTQYIIESKIQYIQKAKDTIEYDDIKKAKDISMQDIQSILNASKIYFFKIIYDTSWVSNSYELEDVINGPIIDFIKNKKNTPIIKFITNIENTNTDHHYVQDIQDVQSVLYFQYIKNIQFTEQKKTIQDIQDIQNIKEEELQSIHTKIINATKSIVTNIQFIKPIQDNKDIDFIKDKNNTKYFKFISNVSQNIKNTPRIQDIRYIQDVQDIQFIKFEIQKTPLGIMDIWVNHPDNKKCVYTPTKIKKTIQFNEEKNQTYTDKYTAREHIDYYPSEKNAALFEHQDNVDKYGLIPAQLIASKKALESAGEGAIGVLKTLTTPIKKSGKMEI